MNDNKVLVLRTCANDMSDHAGQVWPDAGLVVCEHWKPSKKLENGLVGLLWGEGSSAQLSLRADAKWIVCEVNVDHIIKLDEDGILKFPEAEVVHADTLIAGYGSTLTAADSSSLTAGYGSTEIAGGDSSLIVGYGSTQTTGQDSTQIAGDRSKLLAGSNSHLTAGDRSKLTAGDDCTLMGGDKSVLTAGKNSILVGGARSKLIGSLDSTLTGGENATLIFRCWNGKRYKNVVAHTGKDGVEAYVPYQVDEADNIVTRPDE